MFSQQAEASQQELGFLSFPVDCLFLAKCKMRCISWMRGISSVFSNSILYDRVGNGRVEHEGICGVCEHMHACVDREWCIVWEENAFFYPGYS